MPAPTAPNKPSYYRRAGTILEGDLEGKVAGTGDVAYWRRGGTVLFPSAFQGSSAVTASAGVATVSIAAYAPTP